MASGIKLTYEEVRKTFESYGYILDDTEYINNKKKLTFHDNEGYYYYQSFDGIFNKCFPRKFYKSNPYTIQNIKLWCKLNNKPFELISEVYKLATIDLKWKCLKDDCGEIFNLSWNCVLNGIGCGYCHGQVLGKSNCLANKRPDLASEWHTILNGNLTPYDVTKSCKQHVWWQCSKNPKHEWYAKISNRYNGRGCPYCSGNLPSEDYNLLICNPELCKEWNYEKNDKKPNEYTPHSNQSVYWKCKDCGHEWKSCISDRSYGRGCPECFKSKGEKRIKEILNLHVINFNPQKEFEGLVGLGYKNLSYDFYLPDYNLLIEYQGEQHEKYIKGLHKSKKDFEKQQEHDRRKREYAKQNNYNLLEIWYWDFDNIETILTQYLTKN